MGMASPSEMIAGDGVADGQCEEAEADCQHDEVEHGCSLSNELEQKLKYGAAYKEAMGIFIATHQDVIRIASTAFMPPPFMTPLYRCPDFPIEFLFGWTHIAAIGSRRASAIIRRNVDDRSCARKPQISTAE
jgi:hypothetical protein